MTKQDCDKPDKDVASLKCYDSIPSASSNSEPLKSDKIEEAKVKMSDRDLQKVLEDAYKSMEQGGLDTLSSGKLVKIHKTLSDMMFSVAMALRSKCPSPSSQSSQEES